MSQRLHKAKADHNGEWVFGYYLEVGGVPFILPEGNPLNAIVQVRPETVCQCVGMIDRNGITSFEFDKVFDPNVRKTFLIKSDKELSGFLLVDEAGWETKDISRLFYCEIVGNIYDKVVSHA